MRKFTALLLAFVLVFGSGASFAQVASAAGQLTLVPDAKATIQIKQSEETDQSANRKLVVDSSTAVMPLKDYAMSVHALPVHMESEDGQVVDWDGEEITFTSSNEDVLTIEDDWIHGKSAGSADVIIEYEGKQLRIEVQVTDKFVGIQIASENAAYLDAYYLRYYDEAEKSYSYMDVQTEYDEKTKVIKILGIDWSKPGPYYVDFVYENFIQSVEIKSTDVNKVKKLSAKPADYANVKLDTGDVAISQMTAQYMKKGMPVVDGTWVELAEQYNISPGDYVFNVSGTKDKDFYLVSTPQQSLKKGEQTVTVSFDSTVAIEKHVDLKEDSKVQELYVCGAFCENVSGDYERIHVPKGSDINISPVIENSSLYYQLEYDWKTIDGDRKLSIDDTFTSSLAFEDKVYEGGSSLDMEQVLSIQNAAGSDLAFIYDQDYNFYSGSLTFQNVDDAAEVYEVPLHMAFYGELELPNVTGTFDVTFSIGEVTLDLPPTFIDLEDDWYHWADSTANVTTDYTWTIRFNAPIDESTVNRSSIVVTDAEGNVVPGVAFYIHSNEIYVYAPEDGYEEGQEYYLCVSNSILNIAGKSMKHNIKMNFIAEGVSE